MQQFTIANGTSAPQKKIFDAINQAITILGVDTDAFDIEFRCQLMQACQNIAVSAQVEIARELHTNQKVRPLLEKHPVAQQLLRLDKTLDKVLVPEARMQIGIRKYPTTAEQVDHMLQTAVAHGQVIISQSAKSLMNELGRFQDIPGFMLDSEQLKTKSLYASVTLAETKPLEDCSYENLLQIVAAGKPIANNKGSFNWWGDIPEFTMETSVPANNVRNALTNAIKEMADRKGITTEQKAKLDGLCDAINVNICAIADAPRANSIGLNFEPNITLPNLTIKTLTQKSPPVAPEPSKASPRQKRFFAAMDKVQRLAGGTASEFDYNVRNRLGLLIYNAPARFSNELAKRINADYGTSLEVAGDLPKSQFSRMMETVNGLPIDIKAVGEAPPKEQVEPAYSQVPLTNAMSVVMAKRMAGRLDVLYDQTMTPEVKHYNEFIATGIRHMEQRLAGSNVRFRQYDESRHLLRDYQSGAKELHELDASPIPYEWKHYSINMPSERHLLLTAIEDAAYLQADQNNIKSKQRAAMAEAVLEMRAAYADAVMSPEEYAAKEKAVADKAEADRLEAKRIADEKADEEKRRAEEHKARQEEARLKQQAEDAVRIIPFQFSGPAQSLLDRGNPTRQLPNKPNERCVAMRYRDVVEREVMPIKALLNRNFEPHLNLGNALFVDNNSQVARGIVSLCDNGTSVSTNDAGREKAARALERVLTLPAEDTPVYKVNQEAQEKLVQALMQAPLLITAALGTRVQLENMKRVQNELFPERTKNKLSDYDQARLLHERGAIAMDAIRTAGVKLPDEWMAKLEEKLVPPAPPAPPPVEKPVIPVAVIPAAVIPAVVNPPVTDEPAKPVDVPVVPPVPVDTPPVDHPPANGGKNGKHEPVPVDDLILQTWDYIEKHQPQYYQLRMHLRQNGENTIVITLADKDGRCQTPLYLNTHQPDINLALEAFRRVQAEALCIKGVVDFTDPAIPQHTDAQMQEPIPNATPEIRTQTKHGSYYAALVFPAGNGRKREEMSINLGLPNRPDNREIAAQRTQRVLELIEEQREVFNALGGGNFLSITKQHLINFLKQEVMAARGEWVYPESQYIHEEFPHSIRINGGGNNWLVIPPMRQSGMVDNNWVQPLKFVINGHQLEAGNAEINTHINDRHVAQERGREIVDQMLLSLNGMRFATDPDKPGHLRRVTPEELAADPSLVDHARLRRLQGRVRALYEQDIAVIQHDQQPDGAGNIRFTLELTRGQRNQLNEPMRETDQPGGGTGILRYFSVPEAQAADIDPFVAAIQKSVRDNLEASYHPTTRGSDSPDGVEKEKPRMRFSPDRARVALEKGIVSALGRHPSIQRFQPPHAEREDERRNPPAENMR